MGRHTPKKPLPLDFSVQSLFVLSIINLFSRIVWGFSSKAATLLAKYINHYLLFSCSILHYFSFSFFLCTYHINTSVVSWDLTMLKISR